MTQSQIPDTPASSSKKPNTTKGQPRKRRPKQSRYRRIWQQIQVGLTEIGKHKAFLYLAIVAIIFISQATLGVTIEEVGIPGIVSIKFNSNPTAVVSPAPTIIPTDSLTEEPGPTSAVTVTLPVVSSVECEQDTSSNAPVTQGEVRIPTVLNRTVDEARAAMDRAGLRARIICETPAESADCGQVFDTQPMHGQPVAPGTEVKLYVYWPCGATPDASQHKVVRTTTTPMAGWLALASR
jgi:PASTA domain